MKITHLKKIVVFAALAFGSFFAGAADVFYWQGTSSWKDWGDLSNWSLQKGSYSNPDGKVAGESETDLLYLYGYTYSGDYGTLGYFNLGGVERVITGFSKGSSAGTAYKQWYLHLTNGMLRVNKPSTLDNATAGYEIYSGATVVYGTNSAPKYTCSHIGMQAYWNVHAGGRMEVRGKELVMANITANIAAGGTLVFNPDAFSLHYGHNKSRSTQFNVSGALIAPRGLVWNGSDPWLNSGAEKKFTITQKPGSTVFLGGDFSKKLEEDSAKATYTYDWQGGTLEVTNSAKFYNATSKFGTETFARMSGSATANVLVDSTLDLGDFTYQDGVTLTKTGAGLLKVREMPPVLVVQEGSVCFCSTNASLENVTIADGVTVIFGATGNMLPDLENVDAVNFGLSDDYPVSGVILTGCDPAVAEKIAAKIVLPKRLLACTVEAENGTVYLKVPLTVTACSFSVPTGTDAKGCGYKVSGLIDGDLARDVVSGTPVYSFGGYTASSSAGTYAVTVSGLASKKYSMTYMPGEIWAFTPPTEPTVFYWAATGNVSADYTDLSNWKMDKALTQTATRLPCDADKIYGFGSTHEGAYDYYVGSMDLQNGDYTLGGYSSGSAVGSSWKVYWLNVKNGTLTIKDTLRPNAYITYSHDVKDGTLNLNMPLAGSMDCRFLGVTGLSSTFRIGANGVINVYNSPVFLAFSAKIQAGGRLSFDNGTYSINNGAVVDSGNAISNEGGVLDFPNGWNFVGDTWSASADFSKTFKVYQRSGETRLGGDFKKTATDGDKWRRGIYFSFEGGKLVADAGRTVRFVQSLGTISKLPELFATVADNAAVTAEPLEGATLDMSEFTYGEGSSMTKTGAGTLVLAATLPPMLAVESGALELTAARTDLAGVTFADGSKFVFGAKNNVFNAIDNAAKLIFTLDPAKIVKKDVLMTSSDPALLETVRDNFVLPAELVEKYEVAIDGTALKFQRKPIGMAIILR